MSKGSINTHVKGKGKKRKKKKITKCKLKSDRITSISKREASINWLNFAGPKGIRANPVSISQSPNNEELGKTKVLKSVQKIEVTKVLALDCEMVSDLNDEDMLARISLVNFKLECIYDKYVKPSAKVGDFRTRFSGIREEDLANGADFETVRTEVKQLLYNKILVGHALGNDFKVLKFGHHKRLIRDTSKYEPFKKANDFKSPSLKMLAKIHLNENIQEGEHNSIEDAKTAMKLYKLFRKEWETSLLNSKSTEAKELQSQSFA